MRKQNIILFSSGVSERNGILAFVKQELDSIGYECSYWRDLFKNARDSSHIALLPMLIKKIPTFDFAVLIAEGHDRTLILRGGEYREEPSMRDNVLFEIGLCTMALGPERTILLTDGKARLPDDLRGAGNASAVGVVLYDPEDVASYIAAAAELKERIKNAQERRLGFIRAIDSYIAEERGSLTPTVIGAAVSTANGYMSNFVLRTLEKINEGVLLEGDAQDALRFFSDDKVFMHIILPSEYSPETPHRSRERQNRMPRGFVVNSRFRKVEFNYQLRNGELHICDFPTTLVTGYQTARMILRIDADDSTDENAERRFNQKELDLFESALRALMNRSFIRETVMHFYGEDSAEEENALVDRLTAMMERVSVERVDY